MNTYFLKKQSTSLLLLMAFFAILLLSSSTAWAKNYTLPQGVALDAKATQAAPWKVNEVIPYSQIIVDAGPYGDIDVYRVFLGVTTKGNYVIQDFYTEGDLKFTDPYQVINAKDVEAYSYNSTKQGIDGVYVAWHRNGNKFREGFFIKGKREGEYRQWYDNGQLLTSTFYKNGLRDGWDMRWNMRGQLSTKCNFIEDLADGICTTWDSINGSKHYEEEFKDGLRHGTFNRWYETGALRDSGNYINGEIQGKWTTWTEDGRIMKVEWYKDDEIVKTDIYIKDEE